MVFSSMTFLCVFLPVVFLLYYIIPSLKCRNILLIIFSLLFYAYGEPVYVLLMIVSTVMNYVFGRMLDEKRQGHRRLVLVLAVVCNLGMLGFFKYTDMLISTGNTLLHLEMKLTHLALPVGISFFTFQAMSYVIDVYRGEAQMQKNYLNVLLYISFFPQLIAGPIVKYHDIQMQINERNADFEEIASGFRRFTVGLGKKVLISNTMALVADGIFAAGSAEVNAFGAWIGAFAYMMQIYYDFSGYSDMAIGLGHMFGFTFLENFEYPYISRNIKEFWRRWHISLSTWFKEYLYIPLGGNRKGKVRTCVNKIIVFLCTGLWHGANWTFVVWGAFHGLFQLLEEALPLRKLPKVLGHTYAVIVVCAGFVIFRADTIHEGIGMIGQMFAGWDFAAVKMSVALQYLTPMFILMAIVAVIGCVPLSGWIRRKTEGQAVVSLLRPLSYVGSLLLLVLCMLSLASGAYNPFIYFRF